MEAASALTALGDEEDESTNDNSRTNSPTNEEKAKEANSSTSDATTSKDDEKRFLPDHKKPDAALTFPEKVRDFISYSLISRVWWEISNSHCGHGTVSYLT